MEKYKVGLTFTEPILGTVPEGNVFEAHVMKHIDDEQVAEELKSAESIEERGTTGFHRNEAGQPFLYDYVIKGFIKDACGMLRRVSGTKSSKVTAHKKKIDGLLFAQPRQIPLIIPDGKVMAKLERPLRANTAQGDRVALACSDTCPPGTRIEFTLIVIGEIKEKLLREWFEYGALRGLGQWRNAGYGSFTYEMEKAKA